MKLEGQVALVTGGVSGIGEATVRELLSRKCKVVMADINKALGAKLASEINSEDLTFIEVDVSDEDSVKNLITKAVEKFGALHIIVNSAGVAGYTNLLKTPTKEWMRVFKINVLGTFLVSKYAAMQMMKQEPINDLKERGVIVNLGSINGVEAPGYLSIYGSSKGAIHGLTLPLARDLGKFGIRVVTLAPGLTMTPMISKSPDDFFEQFKKR